MRRPVPVGTLTREEEPLEARPGAEAAAEAGMPDPRTAAIVISTTTEAEASVTAAEATEAAARGGRAAGPEAATGLAGRQICLHWPPICHGKERLISTLIFPNLYLSFFYI